MTPEKSKQIKKLETTIQTKKDRLENLLTYKKHPNSYDLRASSGSYSDFYLPVSNEIKLAFIDKCIIILKGEIRDLERQYERL